MKKTISLLLVVLMLLVCAACGTTEPTTTPTTASTTEPTTEPITEPTTEPTTEPATEPTQPSQLEVTLEETVIYDENDVKITVTGISYDEWGPVFDLIVENNTDSYIDFGSPFGGSNTANINGIMGYISISAEVDAGCTVNGSFYPFYSELAGIEAIATIKAVDVPLIIYEGVATFDEYWDKLLNYEDVTEKEIAVSFEIATSIAGSYVQKIDDHGDVWYESDGITVISRDLRKTEEGVSVVFVVKNDTEHIIDVDIDLDTVNETWISAYGVGDAYLTVYPNSVAYYECEISQSDLEENYVTEPAETINYFYNIYNRSTDEKIVSWNEMNFVFE